MLATTHPCTEDIDLSAPNAGAGAGWRILHVASEIYPLAKTGGLADVCGALQQAQAEQGADVRLLLPAYPQALDRLGVLRRGRPWPRAGRIARNGSDWSDNAWRYGLPCQVAARLAARLDRGEMAPADRPLP